eukprot:2953598-Pleurochrysis_carterae.AAC.1
MFVRTHLCKTRVREVQYSSVPYSGRQGACIARASCSATAFASRISAPMRVEMWVEQLVRVNNFVTA